MYAIGAIMTMMILGEVKEFLTTEWTAEGAWAELDPLLSGPDQQGRAPIRRQQSSDSALSNQQRVDIHSMSF